MVSQDHHNCQWSTLYHRWLYLESRKVISWGQLPRTALWVNQKDNVYLYEEGLVLILLLLLLLQRVKWTHMFTMKTRKGNCLLITLTLLRYITNYVDSTAVPHTSSYWDLAKIFHDFISP